MEDILELWDVDLADWLSGRRPIPPEHDHPLLRRIMAEAGGGTMRSSSTGIAGITRRKRTVSPTTRRSRSRSR